MVSFGNAPKSHTYRTPTKHAVYGGEGEEEIDAPICTHTLNASTTASRLGTSAVNFGMTPGLTPGKEV